MPQLRIALDPELLRQTRAWVQSEGTTVHALVRELLSRHLQHSSDPLQALRQPERASRSRVLSTGVLVRPSDHAAASRRLSGMP